MTCEECVYYDPEEQICTLTGDFENADSGACEEAEPAL